jgi:membrane fusion protein (multidrug efflux system)
MTAAEPAPKPNGKRNGFLWGLTLFFLAAALGWFLFWFFYLRYHETTDDAYANGYTITVTPVVEGMPIAFFADDTDFVAEGQLVVLLDSTDKRIQYEEELKTLATYAMQVKQLEISVKEQKAALDRAKAVLENARYDYENRRNLVGFQAVSQEDFIHSKNAAVTAEADLQHAQEQLALAQAALGNTELAAHPLIEAQKEKVRQAYYRLKHCAIFAPVSGHVAQRSVELGKWADVNQPLMAIIPQEGMWVDANFKETQLKFMRIGQPAAVRFDLYGRVDFHGKVIGIASGTGSVFSAIPPQNATGNWIKIVQRLPVRIELDPEQLKTYPLRLGLSAYVDVNISDTDLPVLTSEIRKKPVLSTPVMTLDFSDLEAKMNQIILDNMRT